MADGDTEESVVENNSNNNPDSLDNSGAVVEENQVVDNNQLIENDQNENLNQEAANNKPVHVSRSRRIIERVSTGITGFDDMIEGGFEKKSINLVVASGGSGKTIFCMQFLMEGIAQGDNVLYITFEERKDDFYANMLELGWDLDSYEQEDKFSFIEYTPEKVKIMLEEGGGMIESLVLKKKIKRVVIDSITSFGLLFETDFEKRTSAVELYNLLRKWDCTSMLTYERDPLKDSRTTSRVLEFESDSIIILYYVRGTGRRERYVEVLKMRGTNHSKNIYPFSIEPGIGVIVDKSPYMGEIKNLL